MTDRPQPLVPAACSMSGNEWFPFYFDRLRKSKWWRRASDVARARNVMMWGEAFKAAPAGSLPDDDDELAEAAGYGMDVDAFLAVKAEVMAPWVLCADGRWYHPTVCEVVLDAWERTTERRRAAAERQRSRRERIRGGAPVTPQPGDVTRTSEPVTRDIEEVARDFGIQDRTEQHSVDAGASMSDRVERPSRKKPTREEVEAIWSEAPDLARKRSSRADVTTALEAAMRRGHDPADVKRGLSAAYASTVYSGDSAKGIHRLIEKDRWQSFVEEPTAGAAVADFAGPPEVSAAVARAKDEAWARGWLGRCTWRDIPDKAIVCPSSFVAETLRRDAGRELDAIGVRIILKINTAAAPADSAA